MLHGPLLGKALQGGVDINGSGAATRLETAAGTSAVVRLPALLAVAGLLLSGCASEDPAPVEDVAPSVITDPTQGLNDTGAHIHDYWGNQDRLTVVEATHPGGGEPGTGPGFANGEDIVVRTFLPDSGHVFPQGTAAVEATFTWTDDELDSYAAPELWMKTAGQNETKEVASIANGEPVTLEVGAPAADLPHQLLSAWVFELRMSSPEPMPLRFKGAVTLKVDAIRGLPLPLFPAHPDPWKGAAELPLLSAEADLSYFEDLGDGGCNGMACPTLHRPDSGAIVPTSAGYVEVVVVTSTPQPVQLLYHSASSREFSVAQPLLVEGQMLTYELPIETGGDGPYATQSQWEFKVLPEPNGPLRTAWLQQYTIEAKAVK